MSMDDVSEAVDALVAENVSEMPLSPYHHEYATPSRSGTPSVPPGFDLPHAHPSPVMREEPLSKPVSVKPPALPTTTFPQATPTRNIAHLASAHVPRVATPLSTVSVPPSPTPVPAIIVEKKTSTSAKAQSKEKAEKAEKAKEEVKILATDSGLSKTIATQAAQKAVPQVLKSDEDFPTLENAKAKVKDVSVPSAPRAMTATAKKAAAQTPTATPSAAPPAAVAKPATIKKSTPGILNITVPTPPVAKEVPAKAPTPAVKPTIESSGFPPLPTPAPASNTISTSAKGPKTLRVVATPKTEAPPSVAPTTPLSAMLSHPLSLPATRQPSIVSSTPASEIVSDNASHTSASLSRPGSPPPTRIGSAPVRTKTKSQLKKARKEQMKELTEQEIAAIEHPEAEEIGPIMGRKKKQKKPKDSTPTPKAPAESRPETAKVAEKIEIEKTRLASLTSDNFKKGPSPTTDKMPKADEANAKAAKVKAKEEEAVSPDPPAPSVEHEDENAEKRPPSPATVLRDLYSHGEIREPSSLAILNAPHGYNHRADFRNDPLQELDSKLVITEEDRADLIAAKPVRKEQGHSRIMLTPNGDCVRNLTPQEEERYLQLQDNIKAEAGPTQFVPARHNATNGFTLIGGRAVPNGPPTFFPPLDGTHPTGPMDPVSKIQRDEALSYINQYVLPSLSTNSQLERALNANALGDEMLRPTDPQTWSSWGNGPNQSGNGDNRSGQETPYGASRQDGILASGLESMTAHFAVGRENGRGQPLGNVTLLSLPDAESALQSARKETEKLEKNLNKVLKANRRLLLGGGH